VGQCALNHDAIESLLLSYRRLGVINKQTTDELWVSPVSLYRRLAVAKFNLKSLALAVAEILHGV